MSQQETQIQTSNDEADELRKLLAEQEDKIDEVAELVSRVRHEINNPLTGILGQAQLLLREELNEKARKRAETIERLAQRLAQTVAELRLVQRPVRTAAPDAKQAEPAS
jgi:signal transduction histidine kinase